MDKPAAGRNMPGSGFPAYFGLRDGGCGKRNERDA